MILDVVVDTYEFLFHLFNCRFQCCNMVAQILHSSCKIKKMLRRCRHTRDHKSISSFSIRKQEPRGVAWLQNASMPLPLLEGF